LQAGRKRAKQYSVDKFDLFEIDTKLQTTLTSTIVDFYVEKELGEIQAMLFSHLAI